MKRIPLLRRDGTRVAWTLVDTKWFEYLSQWTWRLGSDGYAMRYQRVDGRRNATHMAREILGLERGDPRQPDHKNRNRLDNRTRNLRIASRAQADNNQNRGPQVNGTSGYRGVSWRKSHRKWEAYVKLDGRQHHLGLFGTPEEAHAVASRFRVEHMPFSEERAA